MTVEREKSSLKAKEEECRDDKFTCIPEAEEEEEEAQMKTFLSTTEDKNEKQWRERGGGAATVCQAA